MDIEKLSMSNCSFMKKSPLAFILVCSKSNDNPCEGCFGINNGMCPGYRLLNYNESEKKSQMAPKITNKEIADELKCSKRQVAKMRKDGTLPERYM